MCVACLHKLANSRAGCTPSLQHYFTFYAQSRLHKHYISFQMSGSPDASVLRIANCRNLVTLVTDMQQCEELDAPSVCRHKHCQCDDWLALCVTQTASWKEFVLTGTQLILMHPTILYMAVCTRSWMHLLYPNRTVTCYLHHHTKHTNNTNTLQIDTSEILSKLLK